MHLEDLYPLHNFRVEHIFASSDNEITLQAISQSKSAVCPVCQHRSARRHSRYQRKPKARPCANLGVRLDLTVQRYFCDNTACERKTFAERIPDTVQYYARRTSWLGSLLRFMSFEMSAEAVSRVANQLHIQISPDTVLRIVRSARIEPHGAVRVLGVDDWAFKRGQRYGTILVDLERQRPIELLPDRTQDTFREWLQQHPSIEIISRDRSFEYRAAIEAGAPQACQVVDRWHLVHNLKEKLQEVLPKLLNRAATKQEQKQTPSHRKRKEYFDLVKYLHSKGHSQRQIARSLGISRGTVRRYIAGEQVPDWQSSSYRATLLDRYESYLHKRWQEGCRDVTLLWKELQQRGYAGRRENVYRFLKRFQERNLKFSTRRLVWLFLKNQADLSSDELDELGSALHHSPTVLRIYELVQGFQQLQSQGSADGFDLWLDETEKCEVKKLRDFASGLRQDYEAVRAAFEVDWSNGQVEGQVNRLKTIKRQMYGRAKFDLLRARVLGPP
jgi:transposase